MAWAPAWGYWGWRREHSKAQLPVTCQQTQEQQIGNRSARAGESTKRIAQDRMLPFLSGPPQAPSPPWELWLRLGRQWQEGQQVQPSHGRGAALHPLLGFGNPGTGWQGRCPGHCVSAPALRPDTVLCPRVSKLLSLMQDRLACFRVAQEI